MKTFTHAEALADHTGQLHPSFSAVQARVPYSYLQIDVDIRRMQHSLVDDVPRLKS